MTKAEQIHKALTKSPMASDRQIARIVDCEPKDVQRIRGDMRATGEIPEQEVDEELIDDI